MYAQFFGLREMPFSITPDPSYLYMSPRHQEALGHLLYGTGQYGGFVQLTGEVGTGKTTIIRTLLEQKLDSVDVAMIHNPRQSEQEFVQSICDEFGVAYQSSQISLKGLTDALNTHLLEAHAKGRRVVLIIDEAQDLEPRVLEQVRLLTNLETHKEKLLRIMLVGQPELHDLLSRPDLRQLAQRITARFHLTPLNDLETAEYVRHRLSVAGVQEPIFDAGALEQLYLLGRGVPRLINIICDRALLGAYALNARSISASMVKQAASEAVTISEERRHPAAARRAQDRLQRFWVSTEKIWAVLAFAFAGLFFYQEYHDRKEQAAAQILHRAKAATPATPATAVAPPALAPQPAPAVSAPVNSAADLLLKSTQPLPIVMARLIALWDTKLRLPPGENVCRSLRAESLECYKSEGKWSDLANINRPAILTLSAPGGEQHHVLLRGVSTTHATLETATGAQDVLLAELDALWSGEFLLLWRRETADLLIGPATQGDSVLWLRRRLLQLAGRTPAQFLSAFYDEQLGNTVRRFQKSRGLEPDGVAGTRTLIALGDPQPGTPKLLP